MTMIGRNIWKSIYTIWLFKWRAAQFCSVGRIRLFKMCKIAIKNQSTEKPHISFIQNFVLTLNLPGQVAGWERKLPFLKAGGERRGQLAVRLALVFSFILFFSLSSVEFPGVNFASVPPFFCPPAYWAASSTSPEKFSRAEQHHLPCCTGWRRTLKENCCFSFCGLKTLRKVKCCLIDLTRLRRVPLLYFSVWLSAHFLVMHTHISESLLPVQHPLSHQHSPRTHYSINGVKITVKRTVSLWRYVPNWPPCILQQR